MKLNILRTSFVILLLFLISCIQSELFSQGTSRTRSEKTGMYTAISLGPSKSSIINNGTSSVTDMVTEKKGSFTGVVEIGYFLSENIGVTSGIGLISYSSQQTIDIYQNISIVRDSESELYERRITGSKIAETQKIGTLNVPVCLIVRLPVNENIGVFIQPGLYLALPVNKSFNSSGTFTYKGYYPEYNVLFENLPAYGFPSNVKSSSAGDLELKPIIINYTVNAGLDYYLQKKLQVALSACYIKSMSDISNYSSPDKFQLSSDANNINSLMGGSSKVTVQSFGFRVSVRYYIR